MICLDLQINVVQSNRCTSILGCAIEGLQEAKSTIVIVCCTPLLGPWLLDVLHRQYRPLFYSHQRQNLGSDDRSGCCAESPEHGFHQYRVAMMSMLYLHVGEKECQGQSINVHLNNSLLTIQTQQALATRCTSSNFGMQSIQIPDVC